MDHSAARVRSAILVLVLAQLALATTVVLGREAGRGLPASQAAGALELILFRNLPGTFLCLWLLGRRWRRDAAAAVAERALLRRSLGWLLVRGGIGSLGTVTYFYAGLRIPLAVNQLVLSSSTFMAALLSHFFLRERYGRGRVISSLLGFAGVALVFWDGLRLGPRPDPGYLASLASAVFTATALFSIRRIRAVGNEAIVLSISAAGSAMALLGMAVIGVHLPPLAPRPYGMLVLSGVLGLLHQFGTTWAVREAPAAWVLPAQFSGPVFSLAFGAWLYDERPGVWQIIGVVLALGFGVLLPLRAARLKIVS